MTAKRIIAAVSGASGSVFGLRLLERLRKRGAVESHLVISRSAMRTSQSAKISNMHRNVREPHEFAKSKGSTMYKSNPISSLGFAAALIALLTAAAAATDNQATKIDCSQSGSLMIDVLKSVETPPMTGDVDKDFTAISMAHEKRVVQLMRIEAACGKDAKLRANASKSADDSNERIVQYETQLGSH